MIIDELQELLGEAGATSFVERFVGTNVSIPVSQDGVAFAALCSLVGRDAAIRLQERFQGETIYVPRGDDKGMRQLAHEIARRMAKGESSTAIARSILVVKRISAVHVRRIAAGVAKTDTAPKKLTPA